MLPIVQMCSLATSLLGCSTDGLVRVPSNKYPILKNGDATNWQVSDLYLCDGSYLRVKELLTGLYLAKAAYTEVVYQSLAFLRDGREPDYLDQVWGFDP